MDLDRWTSPLLRACRAGDLARVEGLLPEASQPRADALATRDAAGFTPLMLAAGAGHVALVERLIAWGARPSASPLDGCTDLMAALAAASAARNPSRAGADDSSDARAADHTCATDATHTAVIGGDVIGGDVLAACDRGLDVVDRLLAAGASPSGAAQRAAWTGDRRPLAALLDAGHPVAWPHLARFVHQRAAALGLDPRLIKIGTPERDDRDGIYGYVLGTPDLVALRAPLSLEALAGGSTSLAEALRAGCAVQGQSWTFQDPDPMCEADPRVAFVVDPEAPALPPSATPTFFSSTRDPEALSETLVRVIYEGARDPEALRRCLREAARAAMLDVVKLLVAVGAAALPPDDRPSALALAVSDDRREIVRFLLRAAPPKPHDLNEALSHAAWRGRRALTRRLLAAGADPDGGPTPPAVEAARYGRLPILKVLSAAGADLDRTDPQGRTALMESARRRDPDALRWLLSAGADLRAADADGRTALHFAAEASLKNLAALIQAGAPLEAADASGQTPLSMISGGHRASPDIFKALIQAGADLETRDLQGRTPLHHAVAAPRHSVAILLLEAGADPNARDLQGRTALMMAARFSGIRELATRLIHLGAHLDEQDDQGRTALHAALDHGIFAAHDLLALGARIDLPDTQGQSAEAIIHANPQRYEMVQRWLRDLAARRTP